MPLSQERLKTRRIGGSSSAAAAGVSKYRGSEETRRQYVYRMHGRPGVEKYLTIPADAVNPEDYVVIHRAPGDVIRERRFYPDGRPTPVYVDQEVQRLESDIDNLHTRVGSFVEGFILDRVSPGIIHGSTGLPGGDDSGKLLRLDEAERDYHENVDPDPRSQYATAEVDGYSRNHGAQSGGTAHECKAILIQRKREFGDEYTDKLPADYLWQTNHYLLWPYFDQTELHALFLTMQEKRLIDAMVRSWILDSIDVKDYGKEVILPGYGAVCMTADKAAAYRFGDAENGSALPMNLDIVRRIVDEAPMGTWRVERGPEFERVREYHLETYRDFWHRVEVNIPCIARDWRECQAIYSGRSSRRTKIANDTEKRLYMMYTEKREYKKKLESEMEAIKSELIVSAGNIERVITHDGDPLYNIEERFTAAKDENLGVFLLTESGHDVEDYMKDRGLNWDLIKEAEPEIYSKCRKKGERGVYFK